MIIILLKLGDTTSFDISSTFSTQSSTLPVIFSSIYFLIWVATMFSPLGELFWSLVSTHNPSLSGTVSEINSSSLASKSTRVSFTLPESYVTNSDTV